MGIPAVADPELAELTRRLTRRSADPRAVWRRIARPEQLPPDGGWRVWYVQGGRGSGKTRSGAQALAELIQADTDPGGQYAIVAPTYRDAWTVCVEGESGILAALGTTSGEIKHNSSAVVEYAYRSYGEIGLRSGHTLYVDSADDGALRVQGKNLRAVWGDELGLWARWQTAWDESIRYAVRKGSSRIIVTGTPKASRPARALIRRLLRGEEYGTVITRLRTADNAPNLSEAFYSSVIGAAKGTRLERQELEGELLDDVANALWTRDLLERIQCPAVGQPGGPPFLRQVKIGVDPSDGAEESDEQAYTVMGLGLVDDRHLYVAENWGGQESPAPFARRVILKAIEWNAQIIIEKNHGGAWLGATFTQVMRDVKREGLLPDDRAPYVHLIHASQAKRTRAEPVSAMYEREGGLVRHCKMERRDAAGTPEFVSMVELEDQMATFTGAQGERSPDRMDSLVWAATWFLDHTFGMQQKAGRRKWALDGDGLLDAAGGNLDMPQDKEPSKAERRMATAHGGALSVGGNWGLSDFEPQDDEQPHANGQRMNLRTWR